MYYKSLTKSSVPFCVLLMTLLLFLQAEHVYLLTDKFNEFTGEQVNNVNLGMDSNTYIA